MNLRGEQMIGKPTETPRQAEPRGLEIVPGVVVPEAELWIQRSRSSGPGGQNVNKVNTRIELFFDVEASSVLSADQKRRIRAQLSTRISKAGVLRVTSQTERTQARNIERARSRLAELLAAALHRRRRRRATRPTRAAVERRVESKKQRAVIKQKRRKPSVDD
jgi:ribosome-associated protein